MTGSKDHELLAGSWIVDGGPEQMKVLATYTPIGGGKYMTVESVLNFDWTLGGAAPTATHGTITNGLVEANGGQIDFVLITYALDEQGKAVYIAKSVGNKVFKDQDTISVENLVLNVYNQPETANPVTDKADFVIPQSGTFPPIREYRVKIKP